MFFGMPYWYLSFCNSSQAIELVGLVLVRVYLSLYGGLRAFIKVFGFSVV